MEFRIRMEQEAEAMTAVSDRPVDDGQRDASSAEWRCRPADRGAGWTGNLD
jgi:hypothetical protein